ncbi:MAG TPA: hypothetical protein VH184_05750 [Dongiaceae bacterium]|jgi:hypothetical protein|nr:hypothetical protein [Dongiaceae bacterium]
MPRESQAPVPRPESEKALQRREPGETEVEVLRRQISVMRAYLGIIG